MVEVRNNGFYYENDIIEDISLHLNDNISLDGIITIENIFSFLMGNENDVNKLFNSYTGGFELRPYYNELIKTPTDKELNMVSDILFLEFNWFVEVFEYEDDDCNIQSEYTDYISFVGVSKDNHYSLGMTPVNSYKDIPIKINNSYKIYKKIGDKLPIIESTKEMTLYEFIGSLLHEITFHGYPNQRNGVAKELESDIENMDTNKMISMDELMIEFLEKDLKRLIEEEKFEKADKIQKELNEFYKKRGE